MYIRPGHDRDVDTILRWRRDAAAWLAAHGSDQWSDAGLSTNKFTDRVARSIAMGETWMAVNDDGTPVGTIALDQWSDPGLWSEEQLAESLVLHRMIIDRNSRGRGVGDALLDHAERTAAALGLAWLRLDAWSTNTELHGYYLRRGFDWVRTASGFASGALFQRRVGQHACQLPVTMEQGFRDQQARQGRRTADGHIDHAALADELCATSDQYREAARHVTSPLLLSALDAAANHAAACSHAEARMSPTGKPSA